MRFGLLRCRLLGLGSVLLFLLAPSLVANPAHASEKSRRLYSRGLLEFHEGRLEAALGLFEEAVTADPYDSLAAYYRGVTRGRLGDRLGAIADLRQALRYRPDLHPANLDLGLALLEEGEIEEAGLWLDRARNDPELDARASLYAGVAALRRGETRLAESYLSHARALDADLDPSTRYYLGVTAYRRGHLEEARDHLDAAILARPDSSLAKEAQTFRGRVDRAIAERLELFGSTGLQYDSNVILAPSNETAAAFARSDVGVTNQGDGRATLNLGVNYLLGQSERARLVVGYELYQSLHFVLNQFNLQDHRVNVSLAGRQGPFSLGFTGRYDFFLLQLDGFLREGTVSPFVTWSQGKLGWTEVSLQVRRRDFLKDEFELRNALNLAPAVNQVFRLGRPERYLTLGYQFDRELTDPYREARAFAYDGHQASLGLGWEFPFQMAGEVQYAFRHEMYATEPSNGRRDQEHLAMVVLRRPLNEFLSLRAGYFAQWNRTNSVQIVDDVPQKLFQYDRHIVSLSVEARY